MLSVSPPTDLIIITYQHTHISDLIVLSFVRHGSGWVTGLVRDEDRERGGGVGDSRIDDRFLKWTRKSPSLSD